MSRMVNNPEITNLGRNRVRITINSVSTEEDASDLFVKRDEDFHETIRRAKSWLFSEHGINSWAEYFKASVATKSNFQSGSQTLPERG